MSPRALRPVSRSDHHTHREEQQIVDVPVKSSSTAFCALHSASLSRPYVYVGKSALPIACARYISCVEKGGDETGIRWGAAGMQGWRAGMEDSHLACLDLRAAGAPDLSKYSTKCGAIPPIAAFAVFDGHVSFLLTSGR